MKGRQCKKCFVFHNRGNEHVCDQHILKKLEIARRKAINATRNVNRNLL